MLGTLFENIEQWDINLFLYLNSKHNELFDFLMYWSSEKLIWLPLYLLLLYLLFRRLGLKRTGMVLLLTIVVVGIADSLSVHAFKNVFERYRPCQNLDIKHMIHLVDGHCGGKYGFVSSHAANHFGIAVFIGLILRRKISWILPILILWAFWVSYSRIYLGVHYPLDILGGGLLGVTSALLVFYLWQKLKPQVPDQ